MSQGSLNPKIRLLGQKVCPVSCLHTGTQTHRQNDYCGHPFRVSGFFSFNLSSRISPIIIQMLQHLVLHNFLEFFLIIDRKEITEMTKQDIYVSSHHQVSFSVSYTQNQGEYTRNFQIAVGTLSALAIIVSGYRLVFPCTGFKIFLKLFFCLNSIRSCFIDNFNI